MTHPKGDKLRFSRLGAAIALAAFALAAAGLRAGDDATDGMTIEGIRLSNTSGGVRLHDIKSKNVALANKGRVTVLTEMSADLRPRDQKTSSTMHAVSPRAEIVVNGKEYEAPADKSLPPAPTSEELRALDAREMDARMKGDFVLTGEPATPVVLQFEGKGDLQTQRVVWAEERQRLLSATPFRQSGRQEDGTEVIVSGSGFCVDRDFREWTYFAWDDANPVVIEFKGAPSAGEKGK